MQQSPHSKKEPSDEALAYAAQHQQMAERIQLLSRYIPVVKARVSGYAGGELEPEDLAQEGMIGLMQAIDHYDPARGASFHTFALLCIDRSVISVVRASMAAKKIPAATKVPFEDSDGEYPLERDPEEIVVSQDNIRSLTGQLSEVLSPLERRVFFLYLGGCEYDDIACRLQVSVKTVDNALCRARSKIKKMNL